MSCSPPTVGEAVSNTMSSDSESEAERLVVEERREIVAKYDKGWVKNSEHILPWEDPSYDEAAKIDRYGFIHEKALPERFSELEKKQVQKEVERADKWLKMTKTWDKYMDNAGKKVLLKSRVYKGIPNRIRGDAWKLLLNVDELGRQQPTKYSEMKELARRESPDIRQIDLDINRTYRNHEMFRQRYSIKQQELFHVLAAYSMYNQEVGYCQGMSQIAALLLMYMGEEDAFWAVSQLMAAEKFAMHGFFIQGFPKLARFTAHHDRILAKKLPKLKKHLDKHDIGSSMYTLKWFFQCFLDRVPFTLTLRLWDIYLLEGEVVLTAMSYTLLKLHQRNLLRMGMDQLVHFLQYRLEQDFGYNDEAAIMSLQQCMQELRAAKLSLPSCTEEERELERPTRPFGVVEISSGSLTPRTTRSAGRNRAKTSASVTGHRKSYSVRALNDNDDTESVLNGSIETISTKSEAGGRFTPKELRKSPNLIESEHSDASSVVENSSLPMASSLALDTSITVTQDESSTHTLNNDGSVAANGALPKRRSPSIYDNVSLPGDSASEAIQTDAESAPSVSKVTSATVATSPLEASEIKAHVNTATTIETAQASPSTTIPLADHPDNQNDVRVPLIIDPIASSADRPASPSVRAPVEAVRIFVPYQSRIAGQMVAAACHSATTPPSRRTVDRSNGEPVGDASDLIVLRRAEVHTLAQKERVALTSSTRTLTSLTSSGPSSLDGDVSQGSGVPNPQQQQDPNRITIKVHAMTTVETL